jgi:hypothetical protein
VTFKLGCLPGLIPAGLEEITYYSAGDLPAAPAEVAVPSVAAPGDGTPWGMLGNAEYGDCGVAGLEHGFMANASIVSVTETPATAAQAVSYYMTYDGNQDTGVVLSSYLAYVRANQYYGRTVQAYAPVAVHDIPTLQFSVWAYGFAYTGIKVTSAMMSACPENGTWRPWTILDALGSPIGGHCIPVVGYDDQYLYAVTWGQVQKISYPAWHIMSSEAWAVITGEFADGDTRGVSLQALISDLNEVGT